MGSLLRSTMKSLVAFTYFIVFAMTPGLMDQALEAEGPGLRNQNLETEDQDPRACPNYGHQYIGWEYDNVHDVEDWTDCAWTCGQIGGCKKWSFTHGLCIIHDCYEAVMEK